MRMQEVWRDERNEEKSVGTEIGTLSMRI